MSQPSTTSQKPMPPSSADLNLSIWTYLPRSTPSMSCTPTLTWLSPRCLTIFSASAAVLTWRGSIGSPLLAQTRLTGEIARKPEGNVGKSGDRHGEQDHDDQVRQRDLGNVAQ